jgi:hypothetical protein
VPAYACEHDGADLLQWNLGRSDKTFILVDGGMTPSNNPSFLLYRIAMASAYRLGWTIGEEH